MPEKQQLSARVRGETMETLTTRAEDRGLTRSQYIDDVTERATKLEDLATEAGGDGDDAVRQYRRLVELAQREGRTVDGFLDELENPGPTTFIERLFYSGWRAMSLAVLAILWNLALSVSVALAGPATIVQAFGGSGAIGLILFGFVFLLTATAWLTLATVAGFAVQFHISRSFDESLSWRDMVTGRRGG